MHLKLRSNDVIHSFWVPAFRIKKDVMPDRVTETYITGSELGEYPVVCTELCGAGHAVMRSQVVVQSDADFQSWLASQGVAQAQAAEAAAADPFAAGKAAFNVYGCNACHALASAGAVGAIGPKLDGIGTPRRQHGRRPVCRRVHQDIDPQAGRAHGAGLRRSHAEGLRAARDPGRSGCAGEVFDGAEMTSERMADADRKQRVTPQIR